MTKLPNVYKSNALIESSYRLGVIEQRIILTCLAQVKDRDNLTDEMMYTVSVRDIGDLTESGSKSLYSDLEKAVQRLRRKEVIIYSEPNSGDKLGKRIETSWVQTCSYVPKEGLILLRFNKDMVPYLSRFQQQFTRYRLEDVMRMTSSYAIRLFELLVQYAPIGKRLVSVEEFRSWLRLEDSYPLISDLRRKVLEPGLEQVNEYSSLIATCTTLRKGRRITHFEFAIAWKRGRELQSKSAVDTEPFPASEGKGDQAKPRRQKKSVTMEDIQKYARPGETTEQAKQRLETKLKRDGTLD